MKPDMYLQEEAKWIAQIQLGDHAAFSKIYEKYCPLLHRFLRHMQVEFDAANEIVQATFEKIWQNRSRLDPDRPIQAYIFQIGKHMIYNEVRKNALRDKYLDLVSKVEPVEHLHNERELREIVNAAVESLSPKRKSVFILSRFEGYSIPEIADRLQLSKSTVENHLNAALKFLRAYLDQYGYLRLITLMSSILSYTS